MGSIAVRSSFEYLKLNNLIHLFLMCLLSVGHLYSPYQVQKLLRCPLELLYQTCIQFLFSSWLKISVCNIKETYLVNIPVGPFPILLILKFFLVIIVSLSNWIINLHHADFFPNLMLMLLLL